MTANDTEPQIGGHQDWAACGMRHRQSPAKSLKDLVGVPLLRVLGAERLAFAKDSVIGQRHYIKEES